MVGAGNLREIKMSDKKKEYIQNLTRELISTNAFGITFQTCATMKDFIKHAKEQLLHKSVREMNPATLGKIMGAFEIGDVLASKQELLGDLFFGGDCEELLRELVATCLAYKTYYHLEQ